jgi:hypothetical protein
MATNMEMEFNYLRMEINMMDIIVTVSHRGMEFINGIMEPFIKGNLKME